MLKGNLPWQGIRGTTKEEKNLKVKEMKESITINHLCKGLPREVLQYMYFCRNLGFDEKPLYAELHSLLSKVFVRNTCLKNFQYDWHVTKGKVAKERKDCEDSNRAEYDGMQRQPKRNMSRRLKIQNLASKNHLEVAAAEQEEVKMPDKSKTAIKRGKKINFPALKSSTIIQESAIQKSVLVSTSKAIITSEVEEPKMKKAEFDECDFEAAKITERAHRNDDSIPTERESSDHIKFPMVEYTKNLSHVINNRVKRMATDKVTTKKVECCAIKKHATHPA
eukprot:TRINITY_DN9501_c0_g4_i1.p1 TRINITY_DN9501_c0_g4~~TRINITY_DN9501_c0_g4_i1.p1  ORF type:complete len:279 (-),score=49.97 TRINITY_DN9501_c0_g4_i1:627-1463(-)